MTMAKIHSIETMGLVDGPGIRFVVFMQGCKLRCKYCHNPDTWNASKGEEISSVELLNKVKKYKIYFKNSGGGVTLSGGDPLLQPEFLKEFFKMCKEEDINTCLDTAGFGFGDYDDILKYTDLVLLDIKHINESTHKDLTGQTRESFLEFLDAVKRNSIRLWIRHVIVEGYTDSEEHIKKFTQYVNTIPNVEKIELLGYHTHGEHKYEKLGIKYPLKGVKAFDSDKLENLKNIVKNNLINKSIQMH